MKVIKLLIILLISSVLMQSCSGNKESSSDGVSILDSLNKFKQEVSILDQEFKLLRKEYQKEHNKYEHLALKHITNPSPLNSKAADKQKKVADSLTNLAKENRKQYEILETKITFLNNQLLKEQYK